MVVLRIVLVFLFFVIVQYNASAKGPDVTITISNDRLLSIAEVLNGIGDVLTPLIETIGDIPSHLIKVANGTVTSESVVEETKTKLYQALALSGENIVNQIMKVSTGQETGNVMSTISPIFELINKIMIGGLHNKFNSSENILDIITAVYNADSLGYGGMNTSSLYISMGNGLINSAINTAENTVGSAGNITASTITNAMQTAINVIDRIWNSRKNI